MGKAYEYNIVEYGYGHAVSREDGQKLVQEFLLDHGLSGWLCFKMAKHAPPWQHWTFYFSKELQEDKKTMLQIRRGKR